MKKISHRGNYHYSCENKIECLIKTLLNPDIDGIEVDVRMTKDKKLVLQHNTLIIKDFKIIDVDKNLYKISKLDLLSNLLSQIKNDKIILLDLKCNRNEKVYVKTLIKLISKYSYLNIQLCSFNYKLIKYIKNKYPNYYCGLIIGYQININKEYKIFDFISIHSSLSKKYKYPYYIWGKNALPTNYCIGIIKD